MIGVDRVLVSCCEDLICQYEGDQYYMGIVEGDCVKMLCGFGGDQVGECLQGCSVEGGCFVDEYRLY